MLNDIQTDYPSHTKSKKPVKYIISPEIHQAIKKLYQGETGKGQIREFAKRSGLPRWKVSRYAITNGWIPKKKKEPVWSDTELLIMKRNAHYHPDTIQKKLKNNGFTRSATAIVLKRKRLRLLSNLNGESANSLSHCLGVDIHFILKAIQKGKLKAEKRGSGRTDKQGGDIWFIKTKDIQEYILENVCEIDLRKVDKYWFVDLISNRA